jgi:hypothetical protein
VVVAMVLMSTEDFNFKKRFTQNSSHSAGSVRRDRASGQGHGRRSDVETAAMVLKDDEL